ncbi:MAG: hypothetical protein ACRDZR_03475 [Acidimicrobiales bacterium]
MTTSSPYNPGFGIDPPYLAGRGEQLDLLLRDGLAQGPTSRYFDAAVIGERGLARRRS